MSFTIAEDIKTLLLANFNAANVTGLEELQSDSDLLIYFGFDDNVHDLTGNDYTAIAGSTVEYTTGKTGRALKPDGSATGYVTLDDIALSTATDALSISFWLYWDGTRVSASDLFYNLSGASPVVTIEATSNNQLKFIVTGTGQNIDYTSYINKWTHIIWTIQYDGSASESKVYFDDSQVGITQDLGAKTFPTDGNHLIGKCDGFIDTFRIYNRILTSGQITNLKNLLNPDSTAYFNSIDPVIRLLDDEPDPNDRGFPIIGEIIIGEEQLLRIDPFNGSRSETFLVDIIVSYQEVTATSPERIKSIVAEIDRVMDAESIAHTTYYYRIRYNWLGSYKRGVVNLQVEVLNALVARPGL